MFIDSDFTTYVLSDIVSKGIIDPDEPIFNEFNEYLKTLELDVVLSTFHYKPYNETEPILSDNGSSIGIYLRTTENFIKNNFNENGNWDGNYSNTELIKEKWKKLAFKFNLSEGFYNHISYVWVYDFEKGYLSHLRAAAKSKFVEEVQKLNHKVKPEYIFGSSLPSYNIIYKNKKHFDIGNSKNYFQEISNLANEALTAIDKLKIFKPGMVQINFYHLGMPDLSLYGLSRED